jgi:predicted Zn-dependent protease
VDRQFCRGLRFFVVGRLWFALFAVTLTITGQDVSRQAAEAMRAGRYTEAEQLYRQLIKVSPKEPGWHANLGLALHSQGKYREAAEALERSLKLKPSPGLSAVLGVDYLKLNEPCKAIAPLQASNRTEALADALYGCRRFADAARAYTDIGDTRRAARAWWQARDYAQARPLYEKLAASQSSDPYFAWEFGDTLQRVEGAEVAIPWLEKARGIVEGRAALGKAYVETGKFAAALPLLEEAVKADPDLLLPLSRAYKATGRAAEAERALSEYRKRQASGQN